ncbi:hypothetical protein F5Y06DRAFT_283824 [Hypoxylon sp. FL0890]|nr:hypothetical protein F5Y06DRAFT_283824 [Hypoxylon sp. FL0890]
MKSFIFVLGLEPARVSTSVDGRLLNGVGTYGAVKRSGISGEPFPLVETRSEPNYQPTRWLVYHVTLVGTP